MTQADTAAHNLPADDHGHDAHGHHPKQAHHFDTMDQQVATGKLGMWVFLATEILMFSGLFCAYAVWRARHYDQFDTGHVYLSTFWGAFNTLLLITSSFTMAWAVRAAQLKNNQLCKWLLWATFIGGLGFMCVKYVEYTTKFSHGMGPGMFYTAPEKAQKILDEHAAKEKASHTEDAAAGVAVHAAEAPSGVIEPEPAESAKHAEGGHGGHGHGEFPEEYVHHGFYHSPQKLAEARNFFSIYFCMTGLHGIHVLVGMGLIAWIAIRAGRNEFDAAYNAPVDLVGLYWHLVDLIWIFLFPLLYLIK